MTKEFVVYVEASFGVKAKVGDKVGKGEKIGISLDPSISVVSPVNGVIKDVSFNGKSHVFVIKIKQQKV